MHVRPELMRLEALRTTDSRNVLLRERAFFNASAAKNRPYLHEDVQGGVLPLRAYEPALARAPETVFPPPLSAGPCVCLFPVDWCEHEEAWRVPACGAASVYRLGLTGTETELLETAALGCAGLLAPATELDAPALQFLVELARDCHVTYVPLVWNGNELDVVLETDVPYVGLGAAGVFAGEPVEKALASLRKSRQRLPSTLRAVVFLPADATDTHVRMAMDEGASVVVRAVTS
ncbi:MAG: hypothetical protein IOD12_05105 [Silvanigrellales bacterium]|jgi:hypothetical protein|nr:hypothetical protein [Silvanigrellales bacterium]